MVEVGQAVHYTCLRERVIRLLAKMHINAVAYREGDAWVAQGIEFDIVAHSDAVFDLPEAFIRAVLENIRITKHLGRGPLQGVRPAPQKFRDMFEAAKIEVRPTRQNAGADVALRVAA